MEHLNRIELRGCIGSIKTFSVGDAKVARFALATEYICRNRQGEAIVEVTWHNVSAWESEHCHNVDALAKGNNVHVIGRIRTQRFTASDGSERTIYEVLANNLEVV